MWNLALNADNKVRIAQAGGIEPLVKLLAASTAGQRGKAASQLESIAADALVDVDDWDLRERERSRAAAEALQQELAVMPRAELEAEAARLRHANAKLGELGEAVLEESCRRNHEELVRARAALETAERQQAILAAAARDRVAAALAQSPGPDAPYRSQSPMAMPPN